MTTITSGNKEFLAVEMPRDSSKFEIISDGNPKYRGLWFENGEDKYFPLSNIRLPPGNYKIIGLCSEIMKSEELAKQVVEHTESGYIDYVLFKGHLQNYTDSSTESFASFMTKHSLTESTLLIEKI